MKTLLEIILMDFHAAGTRGKLTKAYIAKWREQNPDYKGASLGNQFRSGSTLAVKPVGHLSRATKAWIAAGNLWPIKLPSAKFNAFVAAYRDEFDEDFYS